jgi:hypothetical protein
MQKAARWFHRRNWRGDCPKVPAADFRKQQLYFMAIEKAGIHGPR